MGSNFSNKLWNASKFVISNIEGLHISKEDLELKLEDKWMFSKLNLAIKNVKEEMEKYNIDISAKHIYDLFKNDFW